MKSSAVRLVVAFALAFGALGAAVTSPASAQTSRTTHTARLSSLETDVLTGLNEIRREHGLAPLRLSPGLTAAAGAHSQEMAQVGYFKHTSADGSAFWKRIQQTYTFPTSYSTWAVGENLVWQSPSLTAPQAVALWMASPEHRANILDPKWREIGIGAVHAEAAPGVYDGQDVTIVTTDFGVRS